MVNERSWHVSFKFRIDRLSVSLSVRIRESTSTPKPLAKAKAAWDPERKDFSLVWTDRSPNSLSGSLPICRLTSSL